MHRPLSEVLSQKYRVYAIDIIGDTNESALSTPLKIRRDYSDSDKSKSAHFYP